jgi:hypothetical protein
MLFIAFVSFNGFFIYLPQFLFSTFRLFFIYYNNLHLEPQWFFYISAFISTFLPYFLLYSAVINAPLPFPAWIMINLSDQLLIRRFLLGNVYALGGQLLFAIHSLPDAPTTHDIGQRI